MEEMKMKVKIITICLITLATCLTGCSSINPYTGEKQISRTTIGTGVGAAGGAIVGGLLGGGKGALIGAAAGGVFGGVTGNYMDRQNAELRQCLVGTGVQVRKQGNNIQLSMASDVTFKLNSADINSRFYTILRSVATVLKKYSRTNIMVAGFTDNTGSTAYNQVLSERRAKSVGDYLVSQCINKNRVFIRGFGVRYPVASNNTIHGRAMNRRVVITLRPIV
jgi:outer membrane protein OmpA-like peptidoglycan-associated protein